MVSQGYDGAAVMSGQCSGVQKKKKTRYGSKCYIHTLLCTLALVDCVKNVKYCIEFLACLKHCMFLCPVLNDMMIS